jgi:hypothetical protein
MKRTLPLALALALSSFPARGQVAKSPASPLDAVAFSRPELRIPSRIVELDRIRGELPSEVGAEADRFRAVAGGDWVLAFDRASGHLALAEGGTPWIPGSANALAAADLGVTESQAATNSVPVEVVARKALALVKDFPGLFGARPEELSLRPEASGPVADYLYNLDFQWTWHGIPVENAHVVFRLNNGNLVQAGAEYVGDSVRRLDPRPTVTLDDAWQLLRTLSGRDGDDEIVEPGRLLFSPVATRAMLDAEEVPPGEGIEYRLVWELAFVRPGIPGTWQGRIDSHSGEILSFRDLDAYGHIRGGVYSTDSTATHDRTETILPFPWADSGASSWADVRGDFPGNSGSCTLTGRTGSSGVVGGVAMTSRCGSIGLGALLFSGLIDFGSSPGYDCTTPGSGGSGNTHAARTQYWALTQAKRKAYDYLPSISWLEGVLPGDTDQDATCNAFWSPGHQNINFFLSGDGCRNTGEVPGVAWHEFGHGLDEHDGNGFSPENGSGEIYGDILAILESHRSCVGEGFLQTPGGGYGDACTSCTGVREADWAKHASGTPATPLGFTQSHCYSSPYQGPCGREGHCEAAPGIQATWDLATRDLTAPPFSMDEASAFQLVERLFYLSRPTATATFSCTNDSSCSAGNLFNVLRVVDDCDGNLANGTPHAPALWAAFHRHQIGCSTAVNTNSSCGCASLGTPVLSGSAGNNQVSLSWTAVSGATGYDVFRNETDCSRGLLRIGSTTGLAFTDTNAVDWTAYHYRVQAKGTSSCPRGPLSACTSLTPATCTFPAAPAFSGATTPAAGQIRLAWSSPAPAGASYTIRRSTGACPGGAFATVATGVAASPWTDTGLTGSQTYSYEISGVDSSGLCESPLSGCISATATGPCGLAPTFAGLGSVLPSENSSCTLDLSWPPATPRCGSSVRYDVHRSTSTPFTPTVWNRVGTGIPSTSFSDNSGIGPGTTYYYVVRARDTSNGATDDNLVTREGVPGGPRTTVGTWSDDAGDTGYAKMIRETPWSVVAASGNGGSKGYSTGPFGDIGCTSLQTPVLEVGAGSVLTFWTKFDIDGADRGVVESSTDGGATWSRVEITPDYPYKAKSSVDACSYPTGKTYIYGSDFNHYTSCTASVPEGTSVRVRWNLSTDPFGLSGGWRVDDVSITNVSLPSSCSSVCPTPPTPDIVNAFGLCSAIQVGWSVDPSYPAYDLKRGTVCGVADTTFANVTSPYVDTTAAPGTTYHYWVVPHSFCTTGAPSACASAAIGGSGAPAAPTGITTTSECTSATLTWAPSPGATSYTLRRASTCGGSGAAVIPNVTSPYVDSTLTEGNSYLYWLTATNGCGTSSPSSCAFVSTPNAPTAPPAPVASNVTCRSVDLTWGASSSASPVTYDVYRTTGNGCFNGFPVNSTPLAGRSFTDGNLAPGTTYGYFVTATNDCGLSLDGGCTVITTPPPCPATPTNVLATGSCGDVTIEWSPAVGATSYDLVRGLACGPAEWTLSGVSSPFHDTTAEPGTNHAYWVIAQSASGPSLPSSCSLAARSVTPVPTIAGDMTNNCPSASATISTESGMSNYQWYRNGTPITGENGSTHQATYSAMYQVSYSSPEGCTGLSDQWSVTIWPCLPPSEVASGPGIWNSITWSNDQTLGWPPLPGGPVYHLHRGSAADLPALLDGSVDSCGRQTSPTPWSATLTEDPADAPGGLWWYLVTASNANGEGTAGYSSIGTRLLDSSGICP